MVPLQLKDPYEVFVKRREFRPGPRLSPRNSFKATQKPIVSFLHLKSLFLNFISQSYATGYIFLHSHMKAKINNKDLLDILQIRKKR